MTNLSGPSPDPATDAPGDRLSLLEIAVRQMEEALAARTARLAEVETAGATADRLVRQIGALTLSLARLDKLQASRERAGAPDTPSRALRRTQSSPPAADRHKAAVPEEPGRPVAPPAGVPPAPPAGTPPAAPADPPAARPQAEPAAVGRLAHHPRDEHGRSLIDPRYSIRPPDPADARPGGG